MTKNRIKCAEAEQFYKKLLTTAQNANIISLDITVIGKGAKIITK